MNMKVKGIARYPHLIKASAPKGSDKYKYGVHVLIHKSDPQCANLTRLHDETKANGFPNGTPTTGFNTCWKDLAIEEPQNTALRDYMCLKASTSAEYGQPGIMGPDMQPILDPELDTNCIGKIVYVAGDFATYNVAAKGVNFYLSATMVTDEDGVLPREALSSIPTAAEIFSRAIDISGVPPVAPPVPQAPSVMAPPAPVAPPMSPAPVAPPMSPAPVAPPALHQMTPAANGMTRDQYIGAGWTDEQLITNGLMLPPNGVMPSFAG